MGTKRARKRRRTFTDEFKRDAVNLVVVEGYTMNAAALAVGVSYTTLREWHRQLAPEAHPAGKMPRWSNCRQRTGDCGSSFATRNWNYAAKRK